MVLVLFRLADRRREQTGLRALARGLVDVTQTRLPGNRVSSHRS